MLSAVQRVYNATAVVVLEVPAGDRIVIGLHRAADQGPDPWTTGRERSSRRPSFS
jgi:hypothetical protein